MDARIYKITNAVNGKIYVGQTHLSLDKRFQRHRKDAYGKVAKRMPILFAIKKYKSKNFKIELLEELTHVTQHEVDNREIYWGKLLNSLSPNGYNLKLGNANGILSQETKDKIGNVHRGKIVSDETRKKLSDSLKGRIRPLSDRLNISKNHSKFWLGKKRSTEDKIKMSKPKTFKHGISPLSKKVIAQCNGFTFRFNSITNAGRFFVFDKPISSGSIAKCCNGRLKTAGKIRGVGVVWNYEY